MSSERCSCGNRADWSCNDCERPTCDACAGPDFRCSGCESDNGEGASLFDDPERVSIEDDSERESDAPHVRESRAMTDHDCEEIEGSGY